MDDRSELVRALIAQAKTGDRTAMGTLLDDYWKKLRSWAGNHRLASPSGGIDVSGVVQETTLYVSQHLNSFHGSSEGEWSAWLQTILDHKMIDEWRARSAGKRGRDRQVPLEVSGADGEPRAHVVAARDTTPSGKVSISEQLLLALSKIAQPQREIIRLRQMEGRSFDVIAELLGLSEQETATHYRLGLRSLKRHLPKLLKD